MNQHYRHVKSGGEYQVIANGYIEATMEKAVVYQSVKTGMTFVRPYEEFHDGRFEPINDAHSGPSSPDLVGDIEEFHRKFGLEYTGVCRTLQGELGDFREGFMNEEYTEYCTNREAALLELSNWEVDQANYTHHLEQQLDALVDLVYVAIGTAHMQGFDFREAWRRVHRANMAKVRATNASESKRGTTFDVVKPEGWEPPSHTDLVEVNDAG